LNILLNAPIDCDVSDLDKPAKAAGINIIACKMIGITPEALSFKGIHCLFHPAYLVQNHLTLYDMMNRNFPDRHNTGTSK
jgi:hypothetical protein